MALNSKLCVAVRNSALTDLVTALGANSLFRWYDGPQPTDADTALGGNTAGVELLLATPTVGTVSAGTLTLGTITGAAATSLLNPCTWASLLTSGAVRKLDMSAGAGVYNLVLNSAVVPSLAACSCSSLTVQLAA